MRKPVVLAALVVALAAASCGVGSDDPPAASHSGLITASEFVVGTNRFPFALVSVDGATLEGAAVWVSFSRVEGDGEVRYAEAVAKWRTIPAKTVHVHPDGEEHLHLDFRGIYVVDAVDLSHEGVWVADFEARMSNRPLVVESAGFRVVSTPGAPGVGEPVPPTENLTIHEAPFADISTRQVESDELHNVSVAQALDAGEPFVVFFASPQFCVSAMCGPVTETLDDARQQLGSTVEFIHIEPWDLRAAREQGQLVPAPVVAEWRLPTEPWTFVVGADGRVAKRFEGLVTVDEVLAAVEPLL